MPAVHRSQPIALGQVDADLLEEVVVVEQAVELDQHRVGLISQFGHARKDVFGRIAVNEHLGASPVWVVAPSFDHRAHAPDRINPAATPAKLHR